ncbi:MAG TPA: hypothetical protein VGE27_15180 [Gemmatimonas sp.]|uniref:hypothetical protein n=1 Tax=Gemmatimonas sp. TaxID=1962908 RepID=UPI002ED8B85C
MTPSRILRHTLVVSACLATLTACEHPIAVVTPHAEVAELMLADSTDASITVRTVDNRSWSGGPLLLCDGQVRTLVPHALDFRGLPVDLVSRRDLDVRGESEDPLVTWEPLRGRGRLIPLAPGTTRVRFLIWHETHADLVTPWLDVHVRPAGQCQAYRLMETP